MNQELKEEFSSVKIVGMSRVLPYLFLSDAHAATKSAKGLKDLGITVIINLCADEVENMFPDSFEYHSFELVDENDCDISEHFDEIYKIIAKVRDEQEQGSRVLIHCDLGQSIAPAMVLAYMLKSAEEKGKNLTLKAAYQFLQSKKGDVAPNDGFMKQLIALEKDLYGEASMRVKNSGKGRKGEKRIAKHD